MQDRMTGVLMRIERNFGFIRVTGKPDHFLHENDLTPKSGMTKGAVIEFTPVQVYGELRPRAVKAVAHYAEEAGHG